MSDASERAFYAHCAFEYELEDCDFEDSWPRPGDPCMNSVVDGSEYCEEHGTEKGAK